MKQFEYKIEQKQSDITEKWLNSLGKKGWDLIGVTCNISDFNTLYFKREIQPVGATWPKKEANAAPIHWNNSHGYKDWDGTYGP